MAIPYGFKKMADGNVRIVALDIEVVQKIYQRYLDGTSLGGIAAALEADQVVAPSGKAKWSHFVIDKILSNGKYVPYAVPMELFVAVQFEKGSRTNTQTNSDGSTQRKTTRYSSQNALSGLIVCAECGSNYRRITRPSGEVVWRCANKVEHGKRICKTSPTISDESIKSKIYMMLSIENFDAKKIEAAIENTFIQHNGDFKFKYKDKTIQIMEY